VCVYGKRSKCWRWVNDWLDYSLGQTSKGELDEAPNLYNYIYPFAFFCLCLSLSLATGQTTKCQRSQTNERFEKGQLFRFWVCLLLSLRYTSAVFVSVYVFRSGIKRDGRK
jgi:hypothetical protein